jgi:WD40 repeat protein
LYYTTYTSNHDPAPNILETGGISHLRSHPKNPGVKPAEWHIWKTLNPLSAPLLYLRIELPAIVTFRPDSDGVEQIKHQKTLRPRFSMRTFRFIVWLLKIMVLPIVTTTSALWILLRYLLKNAELLEAQRCRADGTDESSGDRKPLNSHVSFSTLPRAFASDVELIAASKDGKTVISVGLHNEITIWRVDQGTKVSVDTGNVLLRAASTSSVISTLTRVAIDTRGIYCAVGTGAGVVAVWAIEKGGVRQLPHLSIAHLSAGVTDLQFGASTPDLPDDNFVFSDSNSLLQSSTPPFLLATYENGVAAKWSLENNPTPIYFTSSRRASVVKSSLLRVHPLDRFLVAFSMDDGTLELLETQDTLQPIQQDCCVQAGNPLDTVSGVHACEAKLGGSTRIVVTVATESGTVSIWDGQTGECISVLEDSYGRINNLRVTPVQCETCHFCGQLPLESLSVAFSVDHVVRIFKLYLNDQTRRCSCSRHQLRHVSSRDNLGLRSRSNSTTSQMGSVSPSIPRARLATTFEASAFPVSAHGVHSRRASEKEGGRRSLDTLTVPFSSDEYDCNQDPGCRTPTNSSFWRGAVLVRETDITCERGAWGVNGTHLVGVRRKPRGQGQSQGGSPTPLTSTHSHGLTIATLERWEMWIFDPCNSRLECSLVASLATETPEPSDSQPSSPSPPAPSTDLFPRLPFTRVSPLLITPLHALAGFGNTIGVFKFSIS